MRTLKPTPTKLPRPQSACVLDASKNTQNLAILMDSRQRIRHLRSPEYSYAARINMLIRVHVSRIKHTTCHFPRHSVYSEAACRQGKHRGYKAPWRVVKQTRGGK